MKTRKIPSICLILFLALLFSSPGRTESVVQIQVKTILASKEAGTTDSRLKDLARELQSVFRYSSYQLLGRTSLNLTTNRPGRVSLPEGRTMTIIPKGSKGGRVTLELEILKNNSQIFQTVIRLRNKSSVTIGGPEYRGGNLLFNIFASF